MTRWTYTGRSIEGNRPPPLTQKRRDLRGRAPPAGNATLIGSWNETYSGGTTSKTLDGTLLLVENPTRFWTGSTADDQGRTCEITLDCVNLLANPNLHILVGPGIFDAIGDFYYLVWDGSRPYISETQAGIWPGAISGSSSIYFDVIS